MFMWDTGCRLGEVAKLKIKDLDKKLNKGRFDGSYTKRSKSRAFFLNEDVGRELK